MKIDYSISLLGEPCPYPAIVANEVIHKLKSGEVLEIISDCPQSINGIPPDMKALGHSCEVVQNGSILGFYITKK
ncbi:MULTISPECIES: sulfurtransferase-like selenium metabolism protein YedF [unclassified Campylobacter]|uniref:sulfurtransferase-like selenium metabolism protein YedF n=1 Tax=unclassified Campylobacter TaxID=2593542 RepID=UPI001BD9F794|nr:MULTISPECIES: sulfurtransferase-like selenium metabolism protein YedF [unclassified Campylobacter]MBZ7975454.1 sulfurtransferase-like selenium metabolism protein YedF [Campylobacter sp. RM12637]MBZ7977287.1 sulfurtransferase-like selenium metabolism protein YedF [Campylobacter sp. RM12654]MBZ7979183.1 sulfurtransferase-like selenium metabolism protein YedF [Campylobacter sp. RM12642]MBZ7984563.1 sulfurtransferase-like selenium metabolism protein YedF [Campylobacter sp. RM12647]MBZ7990346.1 